jgi:hypothetical protein
MLLSTIVRVLLCAMADREKRYRRNRRAKGSTQVAVWLAPEEQAKLTAIMESLGFSKSDAIRHAIMNNPDA